LGNGLLLGIDVGKARVGVARSDDGGTFAVPLVTLSRDSAMNELQSLITELEPIELVVGLPLSLNGSETASTTDAREFCSELLQRFKKPVRMVDERLSTVSAGSSLREAKHSAKAQKPMIDQMAATLILQLALDARRAGNNIGEMMVTDE